LLLKGEGARAIAGVLSDIFGGRMARKEGGVQIAVDIDSLDML
jgi:hypothetical protein